jgi:hypothetical protein
MNRIGSVILAYERAWQFRKREELTRPLEFLRRHIQDHIGGLSVSWRFGVGSPDR